MINKWIGIGNLTKDVDIRYSQHGSCVANFTIACNEKYKDHDGNKKELVEYVRIVAFARLGEICGEYLSKGSKVYVEGRLSTRKWQDKDGQDRYTTEIVAREMKMLSGKGEGSGSGGGRQSGEPPWLGPGVGDDLPF